MGWPELTRHAAIALFGVAACCSARAQITKCVDVRGSVLYSDVDEGSCRNAVIVDIAGTAPAAASVQAIAVSRETVPGRTAILLMTGADAPIARQSGWASPAVTRQRASTDAQTVSTARQAFAATDQARAAMRSQKMVSSR